MQTIGFFRQRLVVPSRNVGVYRFALEILRTYWQDREDRL
jgi:hypothetical protein